MRTIKLSSGKKKCLYMHREIFALKGIPVPITVDHRDRDGLNNRWANLRPATRQQQVHNRSRQSNNTSGFIGVSWEKRRKKWQAMGKVDGKQKFLGYFDDPRQAAQVRDDYTRKHHKKFAVTNDRLSQYSI